MKKNLKKTILTGFVALVVSMAFVTAGAAQQKPAALQPAPDRAGIEKFSGVIEKVDRGEKEFVAHFRKETMTFYVGENTQFMEGSIKLAFSDLKKGEWATIQYQKEGTKLVANLVKIWPM